MKGSEAAVQQGWIQKEDWVLDMEPTSGMIQMAHKGRTWFELNVEGITAHASMPEKGGRCNRRNRIYDRRDPKSDGKSTDT